MERHETCRKLELRTLNVTMVELSRSTLQNAGGIHVKNAGATLLAHTVQLFHTAAQGPKHAGA